MRKRTFLIGLLTLVPRLLWASDYLFLNDRYLQETRRMIEQAEPVAAGAFAKGSAPETKFALAVQGLRQQMDEVAHAQRFKKMKPQQVAQVKDQAFADHLNTFKFALNALAAQAGKPPAEVFPAYARWMETETAVVSAGVDQRLSAFQTRFGPESEQINFIELFAGEKVFPGTEGGPSPWEPIFRLSAVQVTTSGPGVVSSFEWGLNHYFLQSEAPVPFRWIGLSNHVGAALSLQYLNDPRLMKFEGRPSFGIMLHLDRKVVGASWDPDTKNVRVTFGYAFQFIPLLL